MAHPHTSHSEPERRETVDLSSGSPKSANGNHLSGYFGLAIAAAILIAVIFLQRIGGP